MTKRIKNQGNGKEQRIDVPVFEVNFDFNYDYPNGDKLPSIWVTLPAWDEEGNYLGRDRVELYPPLSFGPPLDGDGEEALYYGSGYYNEAMGYTDPADHDKRVDCFRAAELLYRHAAARDNVMACLNLGYVYSYDRCEGRYWVDPAERAPDGADGQAAYPREARAFECLAIAADAGIPEACYKLGDMYKHGTGCEPDAVAAHNCYVRALELASSRELPVIMGSIALRLGGCYEEGFGCEQSFSRALQMYRDAATALEVAVDGGETWYEKALAGVKRCQQEIGPEG